MRRNHWRISSKAHINLEMAKNISYYYKCVDMQIVFFNLLSRVRVRSEREERKIEGDLGKSQRACEQLDSQKVRRTPLHVNLLVELTLFVLSIHPKNIFKVPTK